MSDLPLKMSTKNLRILCNKTIARAKLCGSVTRSYSDSGKTPEKTPLYNLHNKYGGKLVDFAGFLLPVQYSDLSVSASHLHTRNSASIFDVSHMLQTRVHGKDCISWFESLCPVDLKGMPENTGSLTVFLNERGGIIDDLIVTKVNDNNLYVVSNAGRLDVDKAHMIETSERLKKQGKDIHIEFWDVTQRGLIALQGPKAVPNLQTLTDVDMTDLLFMSSKIGTVAGIKDCRITRCGYTGEDGVEISVPADKIEHVTEALLQAEEVKLAGLGARDSLRLEAGLCLYGNDIDENVTPVEAALTWLIAKRRRTDSNFPGGDIILRQIKEGVSRRRVGIRMESGAPARKDAILKDPKSLQDIGKITSGCPSPSLSGNVAMGYVNENLKKVGTELVVNIRGKNAPCVVAKMPFLPSHYYVKK